MPKTIQEYELELQKNQEELEIFRLFFDAYEGGIQVVTAEGITIMRNRGCEKIEDMQNQDVVGKNLYDLNLYDTLLTPQIVKEKKQLSMIQKTRSGKELLTTGVPIIKNGKVDKIVFNMNDITELIKTKQALDIQSKLSNRYSAELNFLRQQTLKDNSLIAVSQPMLEVLRLSLRIAQVDSTVLIQGETGCGKGEIAKFIHNNSPYKSGPFIKIDCSSIPENLLESELFGYEKGAFTGAESGGKIGLAELAQNGTLFLDEIGELPLNMQAKVLNLLQDKTIQRIGGKKAISIQTRIIAATNQDLQRMVEEKTFRKDLYYRLNVIPIQIKPLRERREDIEPLINEKISQLNKKYRFNKHLTLEAKYYLKNYEWPGNVRELENLIEMLVVVTPHDLIGVNDLPSPIYKEQSLESAQVQELNSSKKYRELMEAYEKQILFAAAAKTKSIKNLAELLGLEYSTVRKKLRKFNLDVKEQTGQESD